MKFGIMQIQPGGYGRTPHQVYQQHLEQIRVAEELGFYSVWFAEHHFSDYGLLADPLAFIATAAAQTTRIRLGAAVVVVPLHNPIRFAENAAFADVVSGGRLDLGVGRGYQPAEFLGFDIPQDEAQERTEEVIEFAKRAWTGDKFDWEGKFYKGMGISLPVLPLQQPHPPLWLAAVSPSTYERAGSAGRAILTSPNFTPIEMIKANFDTYRNALKHSGHDAKQFSYPLMQQVYVGASDQAGYDEPREASMTYFDLLGRLLPAEVRDGDEDTAGRSYDFYRSVQRNVTNLKYDFLFEHGVSFGDSKRVVDKIKRIEQEVGVDYFISWFSFGNLPHELAMASMRRFAEEVMPAFDVELAPVARSSTS